MNDNPDRMPNVPPFVKFVASAVPMVFDNSLSYYEALCALWKYIQGMTNVINNNATLEEEYIEKFNELKTFVDDYFDNLDVQEEINNKLDQMAEDGTLQEIITAYIQSNVAWTFDNVAEMKTSTNLINGSYAQTLGYSTIGDGENGTYLISDTGTADDVNVILLNNGLYAHLVFTDLIKTNVEFENAINDGKDASSYTGREITIDQSIEITSATQCAFKSFSNITFILNDDMFTWSTPSAYHYIPSFVNCTFIGNGHNIADTGSYVLCNRFVNCNFIDCGIVSNGTMLQSGRFVNCRISNLAGHTFIEAKKVYDTQFISCQCESDNKAIIVDANTTLTNDQSTSMLHFNNCIFESQTANIVKMHDGDVNFANCYTEANTEDMVVVLPTNRTTQPIIKISVKDSRIQTIAGKYFVNVDASYNGSQWSSFVCKNCVLNVGDLINTNDMRYFVIENIEVTGNGHIQPSVEASKIWQVKNSVADFTTSGHCIVKKFPCLITFDSSDGGWHTNLYFVTLSYNNTPRVTCLTDPTKTPTITYDSETGYCDITLHAVRNSYFNSSAVLLDGLTNNLIRNDYYRTTDGYNA